VKEFIASHTMYPKQTAGMGNSAEEYNICKENDACEK
jgi:hypothetical protein